MTLDELRARHVRHAECGGNDCEDDGQPYPCDFVRADDERRKLLAVVEAAALYRSKHQDDCGCEACRAYIPAAYELGRAALDEVKPDGDL